MRLSHYHTNILPGDVICASEHPEDPFYFARYINGTMQCIFSGLGEVVSLDKRSGFIASQNFYSNASKAFAPRISALINRKTDVIGSGMIDKSHDKTIKTYKNHNLPDHFWNLSEKALNAELLNHGINQSMLERILSKYFNSPKDWILPSMHISPTRFVAPSSEEVMKFIMPYFKKNDTSDTSSNFGRFFEFGMNPEWFTKWTHDYWQNGNGKALLLAEQF